jgi:uncharacterized protein DUF4126
MKMDAVSVIALSMGAAWASGINLYATLFMLGYMGTTGNINLPAELDILSNPMVMSAAGFMYCVEFFADKIPGVDSGWDSIHTFIRIPAGAMLAASAVGDVTPAVQLTAALLGGVLATGSHATKSGGRLLINTSPEPFTNWTASISEDLLVIAGLWAALYHPALFLIGLVVFILVMIWLLPRLWRLLKRLCYRIGSYLGLCEPLKETDSLPTKANSIEQS